MNPEKMRTGASSIVNPEFNIPDSQHTEAESNFGLSKKIIASLAVAAGAIGAMGSAEARTMYIDTTTPEISRINSEMEAIGIKNFQVMSGFRPMIRTENGVMYLSSGGGHEVQLKGISADQINREIRRQANGSEDGVNDKINTPSGLFEIKISDYALKVFEEKNIKYSNGEISNGAAILDLAGRNTTEPNTECRISGYKEFYDFVIAQCKELKIVNNKPTIAEVSYKIDGKTLNVSIWNLPKR